MMNQEKLPNISELQDIRKAAVLSLKSFGIQGTDIYLIDLIPLIEIIWADGKIKEGELTLLSGYLPVHVESVNTMAGDDQFMTIERAKIFVLKFLKERPDPKLLKTLRNLVAPVRFLTTDDPVNQNIMQSILNLALDLASESVARTPYASDDRFNSPERKCFFEILDSLCGTALNGDKDK